MTPKERHQQKRDSVYQWLVDWKLSTAAWLAVAAGVGPKSTRFVYDMEKQGRIRKVDTTAIPATIFALTTMGKNEAMEFSEHAHRVIVDASKINHSLIKHNLAIQEVVLGELDDQTTYTPEGRIAPIGVEGEKIPDALLHRRPNGRAEAATAALEVELTLKPPERIYRGYSSYLRAFRDQAYANVVYLFRRRSTRDHYKRLFDAERWPIYERITTSGGRTQWVHGKNQKGEFKWFYPEDHDDYASRFHFRMISDTVPFDPPRSTSSGSPGGTDDDIHAYEASTLPKAQRWYQCQADGHFYGWTKTQGGFVHLISALGHPFRIHRNDWCPTLYEQVSSDTWPELLHWRQVNDIAAYPTPN